MKIHIVKREDCPLKTKLLLYAGAVLLALIIGSLLLAALDVNPFEYYKRMFTMGMIGNKIAYKTFENYLKVFVPLALTSVALSLAFKMRFWNIGGEGQFIVGAIAATWVVLKTKGSMGNVSTLFLMCIAAMLSAGIFGALVAVLKVKFNTNETLLTLMLNYIAMYALNFIGDTKADWNLFLSADSARPTFDSFTKYASFSKIQIGNFGLNICVILTLVIGALIYVYLKKTKQGYEIAVVGDSPGSARYAGMKVGKIVIRTVFISACLIGLAAAFKVGTAGILSTSITDDVGWTGVVVAWLAHLNTLGIFLVSALVSMLHYGSTVAAATFAKVDVNFANMLQGIILFLVLAAEFLIRFRVVVNKKEEE